MFEKLVQILKMNFDRNLVDFLRIWEVLSAFYEKLIANLHYTHVKLTIFTLDILKNIINSVFYFDFSK